MNKVRLKQLNKQIGWTYGQSPKDNGHYWVANINGEVQIAIADGDSATGWAGQYTNLDLTGVVAYQKSNKPLFKI